MEAIKEKVKGKAFPFLGNIYLVHNADFSVNEQESLQKLGWTRYRGYWHCAPEGWSPTVN